jgi:hypothetical protein
MENTGTCAFLDCDNDECRILNEKICSNKSCSFYKSIHDFERDKNRDFLYESYAKDDIGGVRYLYLLNKYHKGVSKSI